MKRKTKLLCSLLYLSVFSGVVFAADYKGMYEIPTPCQGTLDMETHIDLAASLKLAGDHLANSVDPNGVPYWSMNPTAGGMYWPQHNIGRWWDAMLRLENATDFMIPADAEIAFLKTTHRFFNNPDHLCWLPFDDQHLHAFVLYEAHSFRENILALNALIRYRNNSWAKEKAEGAIVTLLKAVGKDGKWNNDTFEYGKNFDNAIWPFTGPIGSHGRMLEAVVWYYENNGQPDALKLAEKLAEMHYENSTSEDGTFGKWKPGHTHSYFNTLRGLLLYGELTNQYKYIERVAVTYENTVRTMIKPSGFVSHDIGKENRGETSSPGDAAQLALWLAVRHGYSKYFDDVERLVRARLIPSQITFGNIENPNDLRIGAYGGMIQHPYGGKTAITDVTSANVHTLVDIYKHIVEYQGNDLKAHLHFDYADEIVEIKSVRHRDADVHVNVKKSLNTWIRLPRWTDRDKVKLTVKGKNLPLQMIGDYIYIPTTKLPGKINIKYNLPVETKTETLAGTEYTLCWRGDEVMGIRPNAESLPFYPDLPEKFEDENDRADQVQPSDNANQ